MECLIVPTALPPLSSILVDSRTLHPQECPCLPTHRVALNGDPNLRCEWAEIVQGEMPIDRLAFFVAAANAVRASPPQGEVPVASKPARAAVRLSHRLAMAGEKS